ncbi:Predicted phosphoesterase [Rhodovulum sp. ES.010]|uniref:metallophosphoesterase family protein n=1 Tax=Rhodovulum sp. ES.010 TaxID=1882821 RepID=UPI0009295B79|nr:metallophosphoesterase [Rhodovulum sp. ES.010]SIO46898.1 Predicted phosphoesterase [Rhodovulum sp. ES.010]
MKILAFSDLHLSRRAAAQLVAAAPEADVVIGAGDFCNRREGLDQAMEMLSGIDRPFVMVPGNCESDEELRLAAPRGAHVLHGDGCEIGGVRFFGLGYGVPPTPFGDWSCDLTEAEAEELMAGCVKTDVLVVHSPPKGVADVTSTGQSVGSVAIREVIKRCRPQLALCGHIHDCWGKAGMIGETRVVNLGPSVNWFEIEGAA